MGANWCKENKETKIVMCGTGCAGKTTVQRAVRLAMALNQSTSITDTFKEDQHRLFDKVITENIIRATQLLTSAALAKFPQDCALPHIQPLLAAITGEAVAHWSVITAQQAEAITQLWLGPSDSVPSSSSSSSMTVPSAPGVDAPAVVAAADSEAAPQAAETVPTPTPALPTADAPAATGGLLQRTFQLMTANEVDANAAYFLPRAASIVSRAQPLSAEDILNVRQETKKMEGAWGENLFVLWLCSMSVPAYCMF